MKPQRGFHRWHLQDALAPTALAPYEPSLYTSQPPFGRVAPFLFKETRKGSFKEMYKLIYASFSSQSFSEMDGVTGFLGVNDLIEDALLSRFRTVNILDVGFKNNPGMLLIMPFSRL